MPNEHEATTPSITDADLLAALLDRQLECPRPASGRQDDFSAIDCILAGECGCEYGCLGASLRTARSRRA
jgi:hypothetical protein